MSEGCEIGNHVNSPWQKLFAKVLCAVGSRLLLLKSAGGTDDDRAYFLGQSTPSTNNREQKRRSDGAAQHTDSSWPHAEMTMENYGPVYCQQVGSVHTRSTGISVPWIGDLDAATQRPKPRLGRVADCSSRCGDNGVGTSDVQPYGAGWPSVYPQSTVSTLTGQPTVQGQSPSSRLLTVDSNEAISKPVHEDRTEHEEHLPCHPSHANDIQCVACNEHVHLSDSITRLAGQLSDTGPCDNNAERTESVDTTESDVIIDQANSPPVPNALPTQPYTPAVHHIHGRVVTVQPPPPPPPPRRPVVIRRQGKSGSAQSQGDCDSDSDDDALPPGDLQPLPGPPDPFSFVAMSTYTKLCCCGPMAVICCSTAKIPSCYPVPIIAVCFSSVKTCRRKK